MSSHISRRDGPTEIRLESPRFVYINDTIIDLDMVDGISTPDWNIGERPDGMKAGLWPKREVITRIIRKGSEDIIVHRGHFTQEEHSVLFGRGDTTTNAVEAAMLDGERVVIKALIKAWMDYKNNPSVKSQPVDPYPDKQYS